MTTTSDQGHHIKPIISSHGQHNCETSDGSSAENSPLRRVTKSSSSSFKRVSFGGSKGNLVQTYVYESLPTVDEGKARTSKSQSSQALAHSSDSPLNKVKVTALESEAPHSILPPTALDTSGSSESGLFPAERRVQIISPPLPSSRRMEVENPFRPDGTLSHEVEPIVETYKHRPFPSGHKDFVDGSLPQPSASSPPLKAVGSRTSSTNGTTVQGANAKVPVAAADTHLRNAQLEIQHKHVGATKAGHLELVHIEPKKRKCGCCSVQ